MRKRLILAVFGLMSVYASYATDTLDIRKDLDKEMSGYQDSMTDQRLTYNLNYLEKALFYSERNAGNWWRTWMILYGAATLGQGAVAVITTDKSTRQDMIVGAGTTLLGIASQLITPVSTGFQAIGPDSVARLTVAEKQKLLQEDESLLKKQADIAQAGKRWQVHALSGAVNLASGLITWIGFKRSFGEGVFNFALNTVITETQIWTQPFWAKKRYKKIIWDLHEEGFQPYPARTPELYGQVSPASCSFGIRF